MQPLLYTRICARLSRWSLMAAVAMLIAIIVAVQVQVVGRYVFFGSSVAGFPFLASIIAIFSGAQLFALGIMGEYLARIHFRTMNRPAYTVAESTSSLRHE